MKTKSQIFMKCKAQAFDNLDLMPVDCLDILLNNYGYGRMENMKPQTIFNMIKEMMMLVNSDPDENEIIETINDWVYA